MNEIKKYGFLLLVVWSLISCNNKKQDVVNNSNQLYLDSLEILFQDVPQWLQTVYDEKSGGFYHNALMVSDSLYGPDMQSTSMALSILSNGNIADLDTVSEGFKSSLKLFVTSRFDTVSKIFTDPVYKGKLLQSERNLARSQGAAASILNKIGADGFILPPLEQKNVPYYLQSLDSFKSWLNKRNWDRVWTAFDHIAMQRNFLKRVPVERADSITNYIQKFVENKQQEDGLWGSGQPMEIRIGGAAKYGTFCMHHNLPMPNADKMYATVLQWLRNNKELDFSEYSVCPICVPRNALRLLFYLKPYLNTEISESDKKTLIVSTYRLLSFYKGEDGGFMKHHAKSDIAPLDLYYGEYDTLVSDINGTHLALTARKALYDIIDEEVPQIHYDKNLGFIVK